MKISGFKKLCNKNNKLTISYKSRLESIAGIL